MRKRTLGLLMPFLLPLGLADGCLMSGCVSEGGGWAISIGSPFRIEFRQYPDAKGEFKNCPGCAKKITIKPLPKLTTKMMIADLRLRIDDNFGSIKSLRSENKTIIEDICKLKRMCVQLNRKLKKSNDKI